MTYTTLEQLRAKSPTRAGIIPYKDWMIVTYLSDLGIEATIFETSDFEDGFDHEEARYINVLHSDNKSFKDQGRAIEWALVMINEMDKENKK